MGGFLYIIKAGDYHKIGIAKDVRKRMSQIKTGSPVGIELRKCYEFDEPRDMEQRIHNALAKKRTSGEWFDITEEDISNVCEMCESMGGVLTSVTPPMPDADKKRRRIETDLFLLECGVRQVYRDGISIRAGNNNGIAVVAIDGYKWCLDEKGILRLKPIDTESEGDKAT